MARTEPEVLNALLQEHDGQVRALLLRFQIDPRACMPAGALDAHSLAAEIAAVLNANGPHASVGDVDGAGTARTTVELRRLAGQFDTDEEPS